MFSFLNDIGNYDTRKVDRTEVKGLEVSTAFTSDEGYETALIDADGVHPVERYPNKEAAIAGHQKWCKEAETATTVVELGGLGGLVGDQQIELVRC